MFLISQFTFSIRRIPQKVKELRRGVPAIVQKIAVDSVIVKKGIMIRRMNAEIKMEMNRIGEAKRRRTLTDGILTTEKAIMAREVVMMCGNGWTEASSTGSRCRRGIMNEILVSTTTEGEGEKKSLRSPEEE